MEFNAPINFLDSSTILRYLDEACANFLAGHISFFGAFPFPSASNLFLARSSRVPFLNLGATPSKHKPVLSRFLLIWSF